MRSGPEKWLAIIVIIVVSILLIDVKFSERKPEYEIEFLNENNALVDSIVNSMDLKERAMVVISEKDKINNYINFLNLSDTNLFDYRIPLKAVLAVPCSDFESFTDFMLYKSYIQGIDVINLQWERCNKSGLEADSAQLALYLNRLGKLTQKLYKHHIHIAIPYNYAPNETEYLQRFYTELFDKGLSFVTVDSLDKVQRLRKYGYNGLTAINLPADEKSLSKFLSSQADILLVDSMKYAYMAYIVSLASVYPALQSSLDKKVKRIVKAKMWSMKRTKPDIPNLYTQKRTIDKVMMNSTVLINKKQIPIKNLTGKRVILFYSGKYPKQFVSTLKFYLPVYEGKSITEYKPRRDDIPVFVAGDIISDSTAKAIAHIDSTKPVITVSLGNVGNLKKLSSVSDLLLVWGDNYWYQIYAAEAITGGIAIKGIFPCKLDNENKQGFVTEKIRLGFATPEIAGMDSRQINQISGMVYTALKNNALPGCQIFVAKDGYIVLNRAYGWHTYSRNRRVKLNDLYDVASVTKVAATTLAAMKLYDQGKLDLDKPLGNYFKDTHIDYKNIKTDTVISKLLISKNELDKYPDWKILEQKGDSLLITDTVYITLTPKLNIFTVTPRQLLMHKSGITPSAPILKYITYKAMKDFIAEQDSNLADTLDYEHLKSLIYSDHYIKDTAEIEVAKNMFLYNKYRDTLWNDMKRLRVWSKKKYAYSDVNMLLMQILIDTITGQPLDKYVKQTYYDPLGLRYITFRPLERFPRNQIIPTERDTVWRKQTLQGYVHDPTAAIMGGVAGNAGLFSNAYSIGVLFQMLLDKGKYGGTQYLRKSTVNTFIKTQPGGYRGLGFDKWTKHNIIAPNASINTFGHTGFTGCAVWADPDNDLVFVFLSNRVYPSAKNWRINTLKIRQKVHEKVYESIVE